MKFYQKPDGKLWSGRNESAPDGKPLYWYQGIKCIDVSQTDIPVLPDSSQGIAIIGYACDEGVRRNQGRVGATDGPDCIRKTMASMAYHLDDRVTIIDVGNIACYDGDMETSQKSVSALVSDLLKESYFPILFGGGHDIAYAHYSGIRHHLNELKVSSNIGIINLDAHFDLRNIMDRGNSGTPFSQIAADCHQFGHTFHYLCLGIQQAANHRMLFEKAGELGVQYLLNDEFTVDNWTRIEAKLETYLDHVDHIYLTVDLDGFSSAYAPGVSAPSPFGFDPEIARKTLKLIGASGKVISMDVAELNPVYDVDNATARLAARLIEMICSFQRDY